ncbi:phage tail tip fiber protein [Enterobacter hormaechei subsp. steigerwaltii]|uniref:phage tail tip fiber protein n=1 Tax=Enterobacter hormaechei TaxID=158836 RepID=UPI003F41E8D6
MGQKITILSGAATDVLYALFFRGALQSGELPSKSGAAQLRELGLAETRLTATAYGKVNHFTFLTAEGQEFAIKHLVNTRFGETVKQEYYSPLGVELECAQKALDEICEEIRSSKAFEKLINGTPIHCQVHITDTMIGDAAVSANYSVKMNVDYGGKPHEAGMTLGVEEGKQQATFKADRFKVHEAASSIIRNAVVSATKVKFKLGDEMTQAVIDAVRESDLFAALQAKIDAQTASVVGLQQAMHEAVNDALRNALKPGGILWNTRSRGI